MAAIEIRSLNQRDPSIITAAFENKPEAIYRRYLEEEAAGKRVCFVATFEGQFAGYLTLNWQPTYPGLAELKIPEIQDLNVLPAFRRRGIAGRLLDAAEDHAGRRSSVVPETVSVDTAPRFAWPVIFPDEIKCVDHRGHRGTQRKRGQS